MTRSQGTAASSILLPGDVPSSMNYQQELNELRSFFASINLPQRLELKPGETITNVGKFLESHYAILEQEDERGGNIPFLLRLQLLRQRLLETGEQG